jgi:cellulose synthase (UDP-forming)
MPEYYDKFLYTNQNPWKYRFLNILGLIFWTLTVWGFVRFLSDQLWVNLVFGIPVFVLSIYHYSHFFFGTFYPGFSAKKHQQKVKSYWQDIGTKYPSVDVLLPICGEEIEILKETWEGVKNIDYAKNKLKVYVLDDGNDPENKKLAKKFGFKYLTRGGVSEFKKAGNIAFGLAKSKGEKFLILDADFVPRPEILKELIPYFDSPDVGIVQSPQYFDTNIDHYKKSDLAYGAAYQQEDFYRFIQPAKAVFNATICVGSNAVYDRKSIQKIGGFPKKDHSEDIQTSIAMQKQGILLNYVPVILAEGLCPDDLQKYLAQQQRWAMGSLEFLIDKNFWLSNLNFMQKMAYLNGILFYLLYTFEKPMWFIPLYVLIFKDNTVDWFGFWIFLPFLIYNFFLVPSFRLQKEKLGASKIKHLLSFIYFYTVINFLFKGGVKWETSGSKQKSPVKKIFPFWLLVAGFSGLYMSAFVIAVITKWDQRISLSSLTVWFWAIYHGYSLVELLFNNYFYILTKAFEKLTNVISSLAILINSTAVLVVVLIATFLPVFPVIYTPTQNQSNSEKQSEVRKLPLVKDKQPDQIINPAPTPDYIFVAQSGSSQTQYATIALQDYATKKGVLLNDQKLFTAVILVVQKLGNRNLDLGEKVVIRTQILEEALSLVGG